MSDGSVRAIEASVQDLLSRHQRLVVAVSGGIDSAVLLDAIARLRTPEDRIVVASVDHGTGPVASESTARVLATAARHGLSATSERLSLTRPGEAAWREGRWSFLRAVAEREGAPVVTAHTRDDHIETVVMRILRGSGARGLAGLLARSPVERPFLNVGRNDIRRYVDRHNVEFTEDPTNSSRDFLRNRIRLDLLPAIRAVAPAFEHDILSISRQASELRTRIDSVAAQFITSGPEHSLIAFDAESLSGFPDSSLKVLLPAILATAGVTLDRRGLVRLVGVVRSSPGTRGQLSGGFEAVRGRRGVAIVISTTPTLGNVKLRSTGETLFGGFRFLADPSASNRAYEGSPRDRDPWRIYIPRSTEAVVRQWTPGDRLTTDLKGGRRRVKRFFADAGIMGPLRAGWPVVVCGEDVVWIPGVRASQEAIRREGRMVHYKCERVRG
jgi:tRNA(Ile)-lysidine synthase